MSQDLCDMPATELAAAIRAKRVSAVEVTDAVLARIDRVNPVVKAFVTVAADQAREAALGQVQEGRCFLPAGDVGVGDLNNQLLATRQKMLESDSLVGVTTAVKDDTKIEVLFEGGPKVLVHGR